jgi:hypothetical protein
MDETFAPSKNSYYGIPRVTGEKFIRSDFDDTAFEMNPVRKVTDHNAIDDVILKEGSPVQFLDNGKWLTLAGSN